MSNQSAHVHVKLDNNRWLSPSIFFILLKRINFAQLTMQRH